MDIILGCFTISIYFYAAKENQNTLFAILLETKKYLID